MAQPDPSGNGQQQQQQAQQLAPDDQWNPYYGQQAYYYPPQDGYGYPQYDQQIGYPKYPQYSGYPMQPQYAGQPLLLQQQQQQQQQQQPRHQQAGVFQPHGVGHQQGNNRMSDTGYQQQQGRSVGYSARGGRGGYRGGRGGGYLDDQGSSWRNQAAGDFMQQQQYQTGGYNPRGGRGGGRGGRGGYQNYPQQQSQGGVQSYADYKRQQEQRAAAATESVAPAPPAARSSPFAMVQRESPARTDPATTEAVADPVENEKAGVLHSGSFLKVETKPVAEPPAAKTAAAERKAEVSTAVHTKEAPVDDWEAEAAAEEIATMGVPAIVPTFSTSAVVASQPEPAVAAKKTDVVGSGLAEDEEPSAGALEEEPDLVFTEEAVAKLVKKGFKEPDARPHLNVVFIGHVDAGKSTTCGNILFITGQVDARTIEKYEREAKEKNRETWYYAYVMDINEEERAKGKTVEVGRATFELGSIRYTILDAPGHKGFVPEMLAGAAQADVGVLIISARKGEFEAGFERGGQTREHAMLAKTLGVDKLIVAVNKMDEPTCEWSQARYDDIVQKLSGFLKSCGFGKDTVYVPISGLNGQNIKNHVSDPNTSNYEPKASWYPISQPTLLQILENLQPPVRDMTGPLRIPLLTGYKDGAIYALGKVESGVAMVDQPAILMPQKIRIKILGVRANEDEYAYARPGENVDLKITGVEEDSLKKGSVISSVANRVPVASKVEVTMVIVELLEHRPILTKGYCAVMHCHTACEEVEITELIESINKATKKRQKKPAFVKQDMSVTCVLTLANPICTEPFALRPKLGRFTLRDEGRTIAIGKINKVIA